jgi:hypothetical protein
LLDALSLLSSEIRDLLLKSSTADGTYSFISRLYPPKNTTLALLLFPNLLLKPPNWGDIKAGSSLCLGVGFGDP